MPHYHSHPADTYWARLGKKNKRYKERRTVGNSCCKWSTVRCVGKIKFMVRSCLRFKNERKTVKFYKYSIFKIVVIVSYFKIASMAFSSVNFSNENNKDFKRPINLYSRNFLFIKTFDSSKIIFKSPLMFEKNLKH